MKCPTCNRTFRTRKAKVETTQDVELRLNREARNSVFARLRKPMPKQTIYKQTGG